MTSLVCGAGHQTTRFARQEFIADPRCFELIPHGFCLQPAWQHPATVERGDIVAVLDPADGRRIIRCVVDRWNRDPDVRADLIDEFGITHHRYLDSWYTPNQPGPFGQPLLRTEDAEHMRSALQQIAETTRAARRHAKIQAQLAAANIVVSQREKPTTRGRLEGYDVPLNLYDKRYDAHESMGLTQYMIRHPAYRKHMRWMAEHHPSYYRMLMENLHEGRGPADLARLENISYSNAKVRLHRARQKLIERLTADGDLSVTPGGHNDRVGLVSVIATGSGS